MTIRISPQISRLTLIKMLRGHIVGKRRDLSSCLTHERAKLEDKGAYVSLKARYQHQCRERRLPSGFNAKVTGQTYMNVRSNEQLSRPHYSF